MRKIEHVFQLTTCQLVNLSTRQLVNSSTQKSIITVEPVGSRELVSHHTEHFLTFLQYVDIHEVYLHCAGIHRFLHTVVMMLAH